MTNKRTTNATRYEQITNEHNEAPAILIVTNKCEMRQFSKYLEQFMDELLLVEPEVRHVHGVRVLIPVRYRVLD